MTTPSDNQSPSSNAGSTPPSGRYRFCRGKAVDPNEGLHPELVDVADGIGQPTTAAGIPNSPQELIAMQNKKEDERPEKPEHVQSPKVKQVLDLIEKLETSELEDLQIAMAVVRHLEQYHDGIVNDMREDEKAKHSQIVAWSVDADRLYRCRLLLESVNLE